MSGYHPCDYGHDHRTASAKERCESRNNTRRVSVQTAPAPYDLIETATGFAVVDRRDGRVVTRSKYLRVAADKRRKLVREWS